MARLDLRDVLAGSLLIMIGGGLAAHSTVNYPIGTPAHMGPGMFPAALGYVLLGLGVLLIVPAIFRAGTLPRVDLRPLICVTAGVVLFGVLVERVGVAPAIFALTIAAVAADDKLGWVGTTCLAVMLSTIAVLIFGVGLGLPIRIFIWPF